MKAKAVGIVVGAGLLGAAALAAGKGRSMHECCREACARAAEKGSSEKGEVCRCGPPSEEGEAQRAAETTGRHAL